MAVELFKTLPFKVEIKLLKLKEERKRSRHAGLCLQYENGNL